MKIALQKFKLFGDSFLESMSYSIFFVGWLLSKFIMEFILYDKRLRF